MTWNVGTKIGAAFGLVLVIFVFVGTVSWRSTTELIEAAESRRNAYRVLIRLDGALSALKDVEIGQRGYLFTGEERYLEPYEAAPAGIFGLIKEIRTLTSRSARYEQRLDQLEPLVDKGLAAVQEEVDARRTLGVEAATRLFKAGHGKALMDDIRKILGEMRDEEQALLDERASAADIGARNAKWTIVLGTLTALVLALAAGVALTRNIAGPLKNLTAAAERIATGDLNPDVPADARGDEVGKLARAFERMLRFLRAMSGAAEQIAAGDLRATLTPQSSADVLGNAFARMAATLREQMRELAEGAGVLSAAAREIVASTTQLGSSASETATAVSETTTTVEEVRQTAEMASQKAKYVADSAQKAAQVSQSGRQSTADVGAAMTRIRQQVDAIAAGMGRLSEQSQAIGQIIATVEDLAAQSNLLAVNAAIEAAKAGEHGKGFSVVAQEVKSLAEQSRQATTQVRTILTDIQKATATAVLATEQGSKAVEAGARQTDVAADAIQALAGSATEAAQAATQIAASSQQQLVGVDQVAAAMENIQQASVQNVTSATQLETAARNLDQLGQQIKQMVARYQI